MDARTLKRIKDAESRPLSHPEARPIVLVTCAGWPSSHLLARSASIWAAATPTVLVLLLLAAIGSGPGGAVSELHSPHVEAVTRH